jgi:hypothetical protein
VAQILVDIKKEFDDGFGNPEMSALLTSLAKSLN